MTHGKGTTMASSSDIAAKLRNERTHRSWESFRLIGGAAALLAALLFRRWLSAEFGMLQSLGVIHFDLHGAPSTALEWFALLQTNKFVGLLLLNFFDLVNYGLAVLMYLGIFSLVKNDDRAYARFAIVLAVIGTSIYFSSNQAMNILSLSHHYFASVNETQKQLILAAGQYSLTANDPVVFGTGVFWGYMFFYAAGLTLSIVMLRNGPFGKCISIVGIVANTFGLAYFFTSILGSSLGIIPALGSAPTNLLWYIATGIQLIRKNKREA
jgi:hypothetical protein